ncbi:ABC transporter [Mycobacterium sp. ITM-2017-0098]|nr:ABC transporter [Mycobacterium sp. ITM-2017-0098]
MNIIFNKVTSVTTPIELAGVDFAYPGRAVFRNLTVSIAPAAVTAVVGSNGSGKSTMLSLLAGVERPACGRVHVAACEVSLAVQRSQVTDNFPVTVAEAVMMGRWRRLGLLRRPKPVDRAAVEHWLTEFGLSTLRHRTLGELSGGQRQRVLLAQAFAQEAPLLLLDEPTTALDAASSALVISHVRRLAAAGTTVVAATHDSALIRVSDHCIDLDGGVGPLG